MSESAKRNAFVHGLAVEPEWTSRFTSFVDEKIDFGSPKTVTYLNAGTGSHAIHLSAELGSNVDVFPVCATPEMQEQAQLKANTEKASIDFSTSTPMGKSEIVVTDVSLFSPENVFEEISEAKKEGIERLIAFFPVSGSYGEVFSVLWEVVTKNGFSGAEVEKLITALPLVSDVEEAVRKLGFSEMNMHTKSDFVEFEDGDAFKDSLLISETLFPKWSKFVEQKDKERILNELAQKIDEESDGLTFRMTIKILVLEGIY